LSRKHRRVGGCSKSSSSSGFVRDEVRAALVEHAAAAPAGAGGARKDILEWVTHGAPADVIDAYTTLPSSTLWEQVVCVRVELVEGKLIELPLAAAGGGETVPGSVPEGAGFGHTIGHTRRTGQGADLRTECLRTTVHETGGH
jgi:hypothetical protein